MKPEKTQGISLIFAIITITIILVIAGTLAQSFLRTNQRNWDLFRSTQAYYAARAAMEEAISLAAASTLGYEDSEDESLTLTTYATDDVRGGFEIFARSKPLDWQDDPAAAVCDAGSLCYVPIPGTGAAGGASCDFEDTSQTWPTDEDDDCNWNKIAYGDTVTIPFYYEDTICPFPTDVDGVCNPWETGWNAFSLRIRTPEGQTLDEAVDDVVVSWQFTGESALGNPEAITPVLVGGMGSSETQIYENDINDNDPILNESTNAEKGSGFKFPIYDFLTDETFFQPSLVLSVIIPLEDDSIPQEAIPYLEYQVIVDTEIADNKIVYTADGRADGRLGTYTRHIQATQATGSDTVINFALQN